MTETGDALQNLVQQHPEWAPWLAVIAETRRGMQDTSWEAYVPERAAQRPRAVPLLTGATLRLEPRAVARMLEELGRSAGRNATPKLAALQAVTDVKVDACAVFVAAVNRDGETLATFAGDLGVDREAFEAVAMLLPMPFLHACNRRWASSDSEAWPQSYCPVCGAWPAFGEVRGVERSRYLRCGSCGAAWQTQCLSCPYCGTSEHAELSSLVAEQSGSRATVEVCNRCLGYLKVFTTLRGSPPANVVLDDLATAELDIAAAANGYKRPQDVARALDVTLSHV